MWGKKLFLFQDAVTVEVHNVAAAQEWYAEKLGLRYSSTECEECSVLMGYSRDDAELCLVDISQKEAPPERPVSLEGPKRPPIIFSTKLATAHEHLSSRGVDVSPIQSDCGGNKFFRFRDLEGNELEVCQET